MKVFQRILTKKRNSQLKIKNKTFIPNPHPEVMGKRVKVKFMVNNLKKEEWFVGVISSYNVLKGEYGIISHVIKKQ